MSIELTKEDMNFVDNYCKRNSINEGQGQKNLLYILIDAYKKDVMDKKVPKLIVQRVTEAIMMNIKCILDDELPKIRETIKEKSLENKQMEE